MQQRIEVGQFQSRSDYSISSTYPRYCSQLDKYVPNYKTQIAAFDQELLDSEFVVKDFCKRTGIKINTDEVVAINESLSSEAGMLLYCYNLWREDTNTDLVRLPNGKFPNVLHLRPKKRHAG